MIHASAANQDAAVRLARLYEQEKLERDERRGLETRATGFVSALLVATGLAVNNDPRLSRGLEVAAATFDGLAILLSFLPLIGLHSTEADSFWKAVKGSFQRRPADIPLRAVDDAAEVTTQHERVRKLVRANASAVTCLRLAGLAAILSAYCLIYGVLSS